VPAPIVTLRDLLRCPRHLLVPRDPVSPYRYLEHLIDVAAARACGAEHVLEVGPGADSAFRYLDPAGLRSASVLDYNPGVLAATRAALPGKSMATIEADVELPETFAALDRRWDLVIANAVLEHLRDDRGFVRGVRGVLRDGGLAVCTTVLGPDLYNAWDHAVGHYRRYTVEGLRGLFDGYAEVQLVQSSILQEWVRPLFFRRIRHLQAGTLEENNWRFGDEHGEMGRPPYAPVFGVLRWLLPAYLLVDWSLRDVQGGIGIVVARR
jgi:SAM-dependent methyltransferase